MLTQDKRDRLDEMVTRKHLENKKAIAQGKKPPHPAIHNLSKIKNLDKLCESVSDKRKLWDAPLESKSKLCKTPKEDWICVKSGGKDFKNNQHKDRVDKLVCKSLDKVLKIEANRLDKEGVENAILKFKKAFHIVEWQDGELTSYKHLTEVVAKGSKPWLKRSTLTLVECVLRMPQFKNRNEISVKDFVDQVFNPVIDILKAEPSSIK